MGLEFSRQIFFSSKNTQISNVTKIRPVTAEFVPCGRTHKENDMTKLTVALRKVCERD